MPFSCDAEDNFNLFKKEFKIFFDLYSSSEESKFLLSAPGYRDAFNLIKMNKISLKMVNDYLMRSPSYSVARKELLITFMKHGKNIIGWNNAENLDKIMEACYKPIYLNDSPEKREEKRKYNNIASKVMPVCFEKIKKKEDLDLDSLERFIKNAVYLGEITNLQSPFSALVNHPVVFELFSSKENPDWIKILKK